MYNPHQPQAHDQSAAVGLSDIPMQFVMQAPKDGIFLFADHSQRNVYVIPGPPMTLQVVLSAYQYSRRHRLAVHVEVGIRSQMKIMMERFFQPVLLARLTNHQRPALSLLSQGAQEPPTIPITEKVICDRLRRRLRKEGRLLHRRAPDRRFPQAVYYTIDASTFKLVDDDLDLIAEAQDYGCLWRGEFVVGLGT